MKKLHFSSDRLPIWSLFSQATVYGLHTSPESIVGTEQVEDVKSNQL